MVLRVICTSDTFIIQNVAKKFTSATHTALIYTAEPVFAAIFAYIICGEVLNLKGFLGALLILLGMVISEVNCKIVFRKNNIKKMFKISD